MDLSLKYQDLKNRIDFAYPVKKKEQDKYLKEHWEGFNKNKRELEGIVRKDFLETLKCIKLNGAEVLGFKIKYIPLYENDTPDSKWDVKITRWKSSDGKIIKDNCQGKPVSSFCPHSALAPILGFMGAPPDPLITQFKEKYGIELIRDPDNDCYHK
jgi:hypothetical protein